MYKFALDHKQCDRDPKSLYTIFGNFATFEISFWQKPSQFDSAEICFFCDIIQKIEDGEPIHTADIQEDFTDGFDGAIEGGDFGSLDITQLNGAEDISELNAIA